MATKKTPEKSEQTEISKEVHKLVHELDDLYYKKPVGFFGYIRVQYKKVTTQKNA